MSTKNVNADHRFKHPTTISETRILWRCERVVGRKRAFPETPRKIFSWFREHSSASFVTIIILEKSKAFQVTNHGYGLRLRLTGHLVQILQIPMTCKIQIATIGKDQIVFNLDQSHALKLAVPLSVTTPQKT